MVLLLCIVVTVMLILFTAYHLWLISLGTTTNEKIKSSQMIWYLEKLIKFLKKWENLSLQEKPFKPSQKSIDYYSLTKADLSLTEIRHELEAAES